MEQNKENNKNVTLSNENLSLKGRKFLKIEGIKEILSTSDSIIFARLKDDSITISGNDINITKLDIELGLLEAEGKFTSIKYGNKGGLLKKIFK